MFRMRTNRLIIISLSILLALTAYGLHTNIGIENNEFLTSDESDVLLFSLNFDLDFLELKVEGEDYHPFFGFLIQHVLLRLTGGDYGLLALANYFLFAVLVFFLLRLSMLVSGRLVPGLIVALLLILHKHFIRNFFLELRVMYHTNVILSLVAMVLLISFISTKRPRDLALFLGISLANILTMETGMLHFTVSVIAGAIFLNRGISLRRMFAASKRYLGILRRDERFDILSLLFINIALMLFLFVLRNHGDNVFQSGDTPSENLLFFSVLLPLPVLFGWYMHGKYLSRNAILGLSCFLQFLVFLVVSLSDNFPSRAIIYLLPISMLALVSLLFILTEKLPVGFLRATGIVLVTLMVFFAGLHLVHDVDRVIEGLEVENSAFMDFSKIIDSLDERGEYLSYSLLFRSYATKDGLDLEADTSIIEQNGLLLRDSYSRGVELYDEEDFVIIVEKNLLEKLWERLDEELDCELIRETEHHLLMDCQVV